MTFDEFYADVEMVTYDKTEYDCMKIAWNAALDAANKSLHDKATCLVPTRRLLEALKTPLEGYKDNEVTHG